MFTLSDFRCLIQLRSALVTQRDLPSDEGYSELLNWEPAAGRELGRRCEHTRLQSDSVCTS